MREERKRNEKNGKGKEGRKKEKGGEGEEKNEEGREWGVEGKGTQRWSKHNRQQRDTPFARSIPLKIRRPSSLLAPLLHGDIEL